MSLEIETCLSELTLDDVADMVGYETPSDGKYTLAIPYAGVEKFSKDGVTRDRIYLVYQVRRVDEKANATDPDATIGSIFTEKFTAAGIEFFKARAKQLLGDTDLRGVAISKICEAIQEAYTKQAGLSAVLKNTVNKKGYDNLQFSKIHTVELVALPEGVNAPIYKPSTVE